MYGLVGAICLYFVRWRPVKLHRLKPYAPKSAARTLQTPAEVVLSWKGVKYTVWTKQGCCGPKVCHRGGS